MKKLSIFAMALTMLAVVGCNNNKTTETMEQNRKFNKKLTSMQR